MKFKPNDIVVCIDNEDPYYNVEAPIKGKIYKIEACDNSHLRIKLSTNWFLNKDFVLVDSKAVKVLFGESSE